MGRGSGGTVLGVMWLAAYALTIVAANLAIERIGMVPVGFGLSAPAGVYFVGLALTCRDMVHERFGAGGAMVAVLAGAMLSYGIAPGFAVASGVAFLFSEVADLAVYAPLRERRWVAGVIVSNMVGAVIDSALFLWLAFGSLDYMAGQVLGKAWMTVLAVIALYWLRSRRAYATGPTV